MAEKVLIWSAQKYPGADYGGMLLPAYYAEVAYVPLAVRIYAGTAPHSGDATFDILDDGVSIFNDHGDIPVPRTAGDGTVYTADTSIALPKGDTSEEMAEDFASDEIEAGSWITCKCNADGAGKNFTIQLEVETLAEADEAEE